MDLHYVVGAEAPILTYKTEVNWAADDSPVIFEDNDPRSRLKVAWRFTKKPIPYCTWVKINTEFVLPYYNAIYYRDVYFTYRNENLTVKLPWLGWNMETPEIENPEKIVDVTGGYIVGSFDITDVSSSRADSVVAEYRFIHQYSYIQSPELHTLTLKGDSGFAAGNLKLGHSYGYLDGDELWEFDKWMTEMPDSLYRLNDKGVKIGVDWSGRLPYPKSVDIKEGYQEVEKR